MVIPPGDARSPAPIVGDLDHPFVSGVGSVEKTDERTPVSRKSVIIAASPQGNAASALSERGFGGGLRPGLPPARGGGRSRGAPRRLRRLLRARRARRPPAPSGRG